MMEMVAQHRVHRNDDFTFELDEYRDDEGHQMLLAHLRVHTWTAQSLKRMRKMWSLFRTVVTAPIFANPPHEVFDPKWARFVTLVGFKPFTTVLCHDGIERPLFIHTCV